MIPYGRQDISEFEIGAVVDALRDSIITQGRRVDKFESRLAEHVGARHAVAFSSGTAALHAAYASVGIGPGNTVLTSPITFVATGNAALYLHGGVRFADVDPANALIDVKAVERVEARDVRVLAPVHYGGNVAALETLRAIADRQAWMVVEDAAHALGARYQSIDGTEHRVGACAHSDLCCFSFHAVKHITTGEGGAVTTNDDLLARRLRRFRTHGITRDPTELEQNDGPWYYEQHDLGFNYRLTDFQCALGTAQLDRLDEFVTRRREHAAYYDAAFTAVAGVQTLVPPIESIGSYHLYVIRVPAACRREVFDLLRSAGIGVNVHYIPVYRQPYYRTHDIAQAACPGAETFYAEAISLPMFPGLVEQDLRRIVQAVADAVSTE